MHSALKLQTMRTRGVAVVELAMVLIPIIILIFGGTEYGRAIYTHNNLEKAVRNGVRHMSQYESTPEIRTQATNLVLCGQLVCTANDPITATGLTRQMITVCDYLCSDHLITRSQAPAGGGGGRGGRGDDDEDRDNQGDTAQDIKLVSVTIRGYRFNSVAEFVMPDTGFKDISAWMRSHTGVAIDAQEGNGGHDDD